MAKLVRVTLTAAALAVATLAAAAAAPPDPSPITPALTAAAQKEGHVVWYTSAELGLVETVAHAFEAKYPGISVQVERSGAERNFQRLGQEYGSSIHAADVIDSSDATNFLFWKQEGWLAPYLPAIVPTYVPAQYRDPDGLYAAWRSTLSIMAYNTKLVTAAAAPKSFADLLAPQWMGKLVKAHPGYSGTILTATYEMAQALGWDYFEKLGRQHVMQTQSANDPPRKLALGEQAVMVDGVEYLLLSEKQRGAPVAPIYPREGTPFIVGSCGVLKAAPHPEAARLFASYLFSDAAQQLITTVGGLRSLDPRVKERPDQVPLKSIKLLPDDPQAILAHTDEIKRRYAKDFGI